MKAYSHLVESLTTAIEVEQKLLGSLAPKEMYEPMAYILGLGGKRIRPLLTLIACDLFGAKAIKAINAAIAVELFHNFSLIHDDILDNAPLRRGSKTVHEKWSQNIAILSGDGMLVSAYSRLAQSYPQHIVELVKLFNKTAIEVCEGQQLDMNFETQDKVSVDDYIHMITYKTAVLLGCSLQMGAICADANKDDQEHLYEFGKHVGIAFQILDDVLDVYADVEKFGKQVGGDIIANKKTFLLLKAMELSNKDQSAGLRSLIMNHSISNDEKVKQVTDLYNVLNIKSLAMQEANRHTDIALGHLNEVNADAGKKEELKKFALFLLNREV